MGHEWESEPSHVEWRDGDTGMPCLMHRNALGAWCGYVAVPPGHPAHGRSYGHLEDHLDVHGGVTYADKCQGAICHTPQPGEPDDVWWVGFDCCHADDLSPKQYFYSGQQTYRNAAYVEGEVRSLAQQLAALSR